VQICQSILHLPASRRDTHQQMTGSCGEPFRAIVGEAWLLNQLMDAEPRSVTLTDWPLAQSARCSRADSHVFVGANDVAAPKSTTLRSAPSVPEGKAEPKGRIFYRTGIFGITKPIDGKLATHANGGTIGGARARRASSISPACPIRPATRSARCTAAERAPPCHDNRGVWARACRACLQARRRWGAPSLEPFGAKEEGLRRLEPPVASASLGQSRGSKRWLRRTVRIWRGQVPSGGRLVG
jgi:hypothetical protein